MKATLGFVADLSKLSKQVLREQLREMKVEFTSISNGQISLSNHPTKEVKDQLKQRLEAYGITFLEDRRDTFIQNVKSTIIEMIDNTDTDQSLKTSEYLERKLLKSYSSIARTFKEETYTSIENFIILQKVERAKELMLADHCTLTEIAHQLKYSSVAHLSAQFKKTTGLSASSFVRIVKQRKSIDQGHKTR